MRRILERPVKPVNVSEKSNVADLLLRMSQTAFQGKQLGLALAAYKQMLSEKCIIMVGLAGAMVPAGMRELVTYLIRNNAIDCLVSTGANLFHDIHESLGRFHYQGRVHADDIALQKQKIDRIYDVFASEKEFIKTDGFIAGFCRKLGQERSYTTREFLRLLGEALAGAGEKEGILTSAFKKRVPVYCPAIGDSGIGIAVSINKPWERVTFDIVGDVEETARMVNTELPTGVVYIGGGTPKNFIQQTEVTSSFMARRGPGHKYAIQITTDSPQWGGLSGCTFEEAQSWGKIAKKAKMVTVNCDATIALPILVTGLAQSAGSLLKKRRNIDLSFAWQK